MHPSRNDEWNKMDFPSSQFWVGKPSFKTRSQRRAAAMADNIPGPDFAGLIIQAIIQAANAAAAANPPQQPPPPVPIVPPAFALLPGMTNDNPLDINKEADVKLFNRGIQGIEPQV